MMKAGSVSGPEPEVGRWRQKRSHSSVPTSGSQEFGRPWANASIESWRPASGRGPARPGRAARTAEHQPRARPRPGLPRPDVTSGPSSGGSPGGQPDDWVPPRSTPMKSASDPDAFPAGEGDSISAVPVSGAAGRAAPAAAAFPPGAAGEPSAVPLVGDVAAERHRLPARVVGYWRWRACYFSLPLVVLLIGVAIVVPWGPWWVRWGFVGVVVAVIAVGIVMLPPIR